MLSFRDMTFCKSDCTNEACGRHFGPTDRAAADIWWGKPDAPVAWSNFAEACDHYARPDKEVKTDGQR